MVLSAPSVQPPAESQRGPL
uniref:Uncharacterized protein n=1 Tax=Arundo donax TaxID=35708 RepID=A0A0A9C4B1_ARUDO